MIITVTYMGGPLAGLELRHPENIARGVPLLRRATMCLKDQDIDRTAAGVYHIEERSEAISETPSAFVATKREAAPLRTWFVAVHHPSEHDEDWHVLEPEPAKEPEVKPKKERKKPIVLPAVHPLAKKLAPIAARRAKKDKDGTP